MSGPLIELGPVTVERVISWRDLRAAGDPYAAEDLMRFRVRAAVRVLPDGLLPLLTLPVHDEPLPSDKDVTVRPVTRREEG